MVEPVPNSVMNSLSSRGSLFKQEAACRLLCLPHMESVPDDVSCNAGILGQSMGITCRNRIGKGSRTDPPSSYVYCIAHWRVQQPYVGVGS